MENCWKPLVFIARKQKSVGVLATVDLLEAWKSLYLGIDVPSCKSVGINMLLSSMRLWLTEEFTCVLTVMAHKDQHNSKGANNLRQAFKAPLVLHQVLFADGSSVCILRQQETKLFGKLRQVPSITYVPIQQRVVGTWWWRGAKLCCVYSLNVWCNAKFDHCHQVEWSLSISDTVCKSIFLFFQCQQLQDWCHPGCIHCNDDQDKAELKMDERISYSKPAYEIQQRDMKINLHSSSAGRIYGKCRKMSCSSQV